MITSLYLLSLGTISNNIKGNITQKIKVINCLNINTFLKNNIIEKLEKFHIQDFINSDIEFKGLFFEHYICNKQTDTIKIILKYYPELVDIPNTEYLGETALYNASSYCNYELVKLLLKYGADPNIKEHEDGETALFMSSYYDNVEITELLLQSGADINMKNKLNETALHTACYQGNLNIVKLLLKYGANPFIKSRFMINNTPLKIAISKNFNKIAEILTRYQSYEDYQDDEDEINS